MIFTTGDSHAQWTFNCIPGVKVHSVSMITMHRVGRMDDNLIPEAVAAMNMQPGDWLILACGEIDCRCHIKLQLEKQGVPLEELLRVLVDGFIERATTLPLNGARLAITSVPPPVPTGKIYHAGVLLPLEGSNEERVLYVTTLNRMLAAECEKLGLPFIDVYTPYADGQGLLRPEPSDGSVHIRDNAAVRERMRQLGILP
jgi:hypothetical protein